MRYIASTLDFFLKIACLATVIYIIALPIKVAPVTLSVYIGQRLAQFHPHG